MTPTRWLLVFDREASSWWANLIAFGHYKHVRAVGYVYDADAWLFYDVQFAGTTIQVARGDCAGRLMAEWAAAADVLRYDSRFSAQSFRSFSALFRPFLCTTAVAHLLGVRGPLRPDALYRQLVRNGARLVHGRTESTAGYAGPTGGTAGPDRAAPAAGCAAE